MLHMSTIFYILSGPLVYVHGILLGGPLIYVHCSLLLDMCAVFTYIHLSNHSVSNDKSHDRRVFTCSGTIIKPRRFPRPLVCSSLVLIVSMVLSRDKVCFLCFCTFRVSFLLAFNSRSSMSHSWMRMLNLATFPTNSGRVRRQDLSISYSSRSNVGDSE